MPIIFAIPAMGFLSRNLGPEKFSIFLLFFSIVGYSSILDAGLSRALVRFISIKKNFIEKSVFFSSSIFFVLIISLFSSTVFYCLKYYLLNVFKVSHDNEIDFLSSILCVSLSIPFYILSSMCFSLFEGEEEFKFLNFFKLMVNPLISVIPVILIISYENNLFYASLGILFSRFLIFVLIFWFSKKYFYIDNIKIKAIVEMLRYSGWITISNTIGPVMMYADRFILSSIYGAKNSSYYIAAADFSQRISIISSAIDKVIFPLLSKENGSNLAWKSALKVSLGAGFFILIPVLIISPYMLELWLGSDFSSDSGIIVQILIGSLFFSSLNVLPYSFIQAVGRSDITAKFHLIQFFPFVFSFYFVCKSYGPIGAAMLVLFRSIFEVIVFFYVAKKIREKHHENS